MEDSIRVYQIPAYKGRASWYCIYGHYYVATHVRGSLVLCCGSQDCGAKVRLRQMGQIPYPNPVHDHEPEGWIFERNAMYQALKTDVLQENVGSTLNQIFERIAARFPVGSPHLLFESVRSTMRRWRMQRQPPVPQSLAAYGEAMAAHPTYGNTIYVGTVNDGSSTAVLLGMEGFAACLREAEVVVVDATFATAPTTPETAQIMTVHAVINNHFFHVCIVMMQRRTRALYTAALRLLWQVAGSPEPTTVLTDFELGLQAAVAEVSPASTVAGCFFHFTQALTRRARAMRLGGADAVMRRNTDGYKLLRMYFAVATVPAASTQAAFEVVRGIGERMGVAGHLEFADYFAAFWMQRIGARRFSCHGCPHRTTNVAESFHASLNRDVSRHPNIWGLTDALNVKMATSASRYVALTNGNLGVRRNMSRSMAGRHSALMAAWAEYVAARITMRRYLETVSAGLAVAGIVVPPEEVPEVALEVELEAHAHHHPRGESPPPLPVLEVELEAHAHHQPRGESPPPLPVLEVELEAHAHHHPRGESPPPIPVLEVELEAHAHHQPRGESPPRTCRCAICYGSKYICAIMCGHLMCQACLARLNALPEQGRVCPICRERVDGLFIRVYPS